MAEYLMMAIGEMREKLNHHAKLLEDISDKLDRLQLRPPPKSFDLRDHLPIIWRLGIAAAVLLGSLKLPPGEASKILLKLF